jgi:hypothetical protein
MWIGLIYFTKALFPFLEVLKGLAYLWFTRPIFFLNYYNFFFYFLQIYNLLYKLSNKQICYKETLVRSNHPMMILLCILYATLLPLSGPLSQRAIAVLVKFIKCSIHSIRYFPRDWSKVQLFHFSLINFLCY